MKLPLKKILLVVASLALIVVECSNNSDTKEDIGDLNTGDNNENGELKDKITLKKENIKDTENNSGSIDLNEIEEAINNLNSDEQDNMGTDTKEDLSLEDEKKGKTCFKVSVKGERKEGNGTLKKPIVCLDDNMLKAQSEIEKIKFLNAEKRKDILMAVGLTSFLTLGVVGAVYFLGPSSSYWDILGEYIPEGFEWLKTNLPNMQHVIELVGDNKSTAIKEICLAPLSPENTLVSFGEIPQAFFQICKDGSCITIIKKAGEICFKFL